MRPGTLATHQLIGMGVAARLAAVRRADDHARQLVLRDRLWEGIGQLPGLFLNGHPRQRACHILNVSVSGVEGESLLFALRKFKNAPGSIRAEISASTERNAQGRLRIPRAKVTIHLAEPAASLERFDRALAQFEQFCTVTQSVRDGIAVDVDVVDGAGVVHATGASAQVAAR